MKKKKKKHFPDILNVWMRSWEGIERKIYIRLKACVSVMEFNCKRVDN